MMKIHDALGRLTIYILTKTNFSDTVKINLIKPILDLQLLIKPLPTDDTED